MYRKALALLLAVLMLCASMVVGASAEAEPEKTVIRMWSSTRHDADYFNEKIDEYNETNTDNIFVEYTIYTDNYDQAVEMAISTNEMPDLISHAATIYSRYVGNGTWYPLNEFMDDAMMERFSTVIVDGINTIDGEIYYLPTMGNAGRLFYNKGIFAQCGIEAPPTSMEEMVEDAKLISDTLGSEGVYGFAMNLKSPGPAFQRSLEFMVQLSGGPREGYDFNNGVYDFTFYTPFLEALREVFTSNAAFPGCESLDIDPLRTQFAAGKIGMYMSWSLAEPGVYANQFPTEEDWDCAPLPTLDGTVIGTQNLNGAAGWMISSASEHKEDAFKVLSALSLDVEFMKGYHEAGLGTSIIPEVLAVAAPSPNIEMRPNLAFTETDRIWPATPINRGGAVIVEGIEYPQVFAALLFGQDDVDTAIADLNVRYNDALDKAVDAGDAMRVVYADFDPADPSGTAK